MPMQKKKTQLSGVGSEQPYLLRIADLLSDDPTIVRIIGKRFKVVAWVDERAKRVNYSFRSENDTAPD